MKNLAASLFAFFFSINLTYAQWTTSAANIYNSNSGYVGIGTTSPAQKLTVVMDGSTNGTGIAIEAVNGSGVGSQPAVAYLNTSAVKRMYSYLDVNSDTYNIANASNSNLLTINQAGNTGIGTTYLAARFNVYQSSALAVPLQSTSFLSSEAGLTDVTSGNSYQHNVWLVRNLNGSGWTTVRIHDAISIDGSFLSPQINTRTWWERDPYYDVQAWGTAANTYMMISQGNLLIGRTSQNNTSYKLDVNGPAHATSIVVNSLGADFVFAPKYKLATLSFLEKYINQNRHLPEIPSAKQMQANGLNVGENETKLLQKVEELTLYLIENDKKEKEQQQKILEQEKRIKLLETKLDQLLKTKINN